MTDKITTQHFDDPLGSLLHVDGKCYIKVSNKTDVIDTPLNVDDQTVYYDTLEHCERQITSKGHVLCPPPPQTLYTCAWIQASSDMSSDTPGLATAPTSMLYVSKPVVVPSITATATFTSNKPHPHPTTSVDPSGDHKIKNTTAMMISTNTFYTGVTITTDIINKMLHK
jgi:hypothetical protein